MKKLTDLLYDISIGFVRALESNAADLAKIEAAKIYVKGVKRVRENFVALVTLVFCLMVLALSAVLIPLVLVLCMDWSAGVKTLAVAALSALYLGIPLAVIHRVTSEKTWMRISRSGEILEKIIGKD